VSEDVLVQGVVKWFNKEKGYGFVTPNGNGFDIFIHAKQLRLSGIDSPLEEGNKVSFVTSKGPKGPFATKITILKG